ncbi:MAG: hypothetical protein HPY62_02490 [Bacteroidales bacterium]|nr:hypothetical protein [Bacteroidales bacterium]
MKQNHNILVCPLEWGLGHASRIIPVARKLREMNHNVIIAGGESLRSFFNAELPDFPFMVFPGFRPAYSKLLPQYLIIALQIPVLIFHIVKEKILLKKIVKELKINLVISDNRFGLWHKDIQTVYITHMPLIPFPKFLKFLEKTGSYLHQLIIRKYTWCLIPDLPGDLNISGRLTHLRKLPSNVIFAGLLSRFAGEVLSLPERTGKEYDLIMLSGPEPQRSILRRKLELLSEDKETETIILTGNPDKNNQSAKEGSKITLYSHLPSNELRALILEAKNITARSGYSTIMDLIALNRTALLIPTPGQTEQEYLAEYLAQKGWFSSVRQKELQKPLILPVTKAKWPPDIISQSRELLERALTKISEGIQKSS